MAYSYNKNYVVSYYDLLKSGKRTVKRDKPVVMEYRSSSDPSKVEKTVEVDSYDEVTGAGWAGAIGVGTSIGKGIGDAVGGYITAKAAAAQYAAQASISTDNAYFAQMGVEQAFRAGEAQLAAIGMKQADTKARQRVAFAANGIAIGVGSSAEQLASTDVQAEADKLTAQQNALAAAWGYRRQRMMSFAEASANRLMARTSKSVGRTNMYAGLASTALNAWAGFNGMS